MYFLNTSMSDFFSLTPWTSMYIKPNGNMYPCESVAWLGHESYCVGNIQTHTIENSWNSDVYKKMRLEVLETNNCVVQNQQAGLDIGCTYLQLRELYNTDINFYKNQTSSDGTFPLNLQTLYIEKSNICNLTCLYCNSTSSSSWAKLIGEPQKERILDDVYWSKLSPFLGKLKEINISGGEPLLDSFSERLLEYLLEYNPDIQVNMTTNLTYDFDKKISFFKKLESFKRKPKIACSVDSKEHLFETIRRGSSWSLVLSNLHKLKKYNVYSFFCIAVNILNCFSLKEFHEYLIEQKLATIDSIRYQPVCHPEYLSIQNLSAEKKLKLKYYLMIYASKLLKLEKELNNNLNVWCNGNKPLSSAILNLATQYLFMKNGDDLFLNKLENISEDILIKSKLITESVA